MSLPERQPQIYQRAPHPSPQLKIVLDYFECFKRRDFETFPKLSRQNPTKKLCLRPWACKARSIGKL